MPRAFTPKVVTGNALLEGDVIYFTDSDSWTRNLKDAEVITDEAVAQVRLLAAPSPRISARISAAPAPPTIFTANRQKPDPRRRHPILGPSAGSSTRTRKDVRLLRV